MNEPTPEHSGDVLDWLHELGKRRAEAAPEFDVEEALRRVHTAELSDGETETVAAQVSYATEPPQADATVAESAAGQSAVVWRKSTASSSGDCVEVAFSHEAVLVRHAQNGAGPVLSFTLAEWNAFLTGARNGEFDTAESS